MHHCQRARANVRASCHGHALLGSSLFTLGGMPRHVVRSGDRASEAVAFWPLAPVCVSLIRHKTQACTTPNVCLLEVRRRSARSAPATACLLPAKSSVLLFRLQFQLSQEALLAHYESSGNLREVRSAGGRKEVRIAILTCWQSVQLLALPGACLVSLSATAVC